MMRLGGLSLALAVALCASGASALVVCTARDGTIYVGDETPPGCVVKGESAASTPAEKPPPARTPPMRADPARDDRERERSAEVDRRRHIQAIRMERVMNRTYASGRFVQGYVVNAADFPVYGVQICIDSANACQPMMPSTLQPGAQGTFSFPTNLLGVPDWRVVWDVVPTK